MSQFRNTSLVSHHGDTYKNRRVGILAGKAGMAGDARKAGKGYHFQPTFCQILECTFLIYFFSDSFLLH